MLWTPRLCWCKGHTCPDAPSRWLSEPGARRQADTLMSSDPFDGHLWFEDSLTALQTFSQTPQQWRLFPPNLLSPLLHPESCVLHGPMALPVFPVSFSQRYFPHKILACLILSWCLGGIALTHRIWLKNQVGNKKGKLNFLYLHYQLMLELVSFVGREKHTNILSPVFTEKYHSLFLWQWLTIVTGLLYL